MCANFKPLTLKQLQDLKLPDIPFEFPEEVYPGYDLPLLFKSPQGLEWRKVMFGLVPKWAEDKNIASKTYNARNETLSQKPTFNNALMKYKFGVIPVAEFYESKYFDHKPSVGVCAAKMVKLFLLRHFTKFVRSGMKWFVQPP